MRTTRRLAILKEEERRKLSATRALSRASALSPAMSLSRRSRAFSLLDLSAMILIALWEGEQLPPLKRRSFTYAARWSKFGLSARVLKEVIRSAIGFYQFVVSFLRAGTHTVISFLLGRNVILFSDFLLVNLCKLLHVS